MPEPIFVSALVDRFSDFLTFRGLGGATSRGQIGLLRHFDRFLAREGFQDRWLTRELIERYAATGHHLHPGTQENRFSLVRQFCCYLRQFEPECFVPERRPPRQRRPCRLPHIYTKDEMKAVLQAAQELPPAGSLRSKTYFTLFGLL